MKRIILGVILAMAIFEPKEPAPKPIEVKPTLVTAIKPPWTIGKTVVRYYQKARMPDGSLCELKSMIPLDEKGWLALADKQWELMKTVELNKPKICPYCGGPMP